MRCPDPDSSRGKALSAQTLTSSELRALFQACVENAEDLVNEARLLLDSGHYSRSFMLGHFANEEAAKTVFLGGTRVDLALGRPIDWLNFWCSWNDHQPKSMTAAHSAWIAPAIEERIAGRLPLSELDGGPWIAPFDPTTIREIAGDAHAARTGSQYVDWDPTTRAVRQPNLGEDPARLMVATATFMVGQARLQLETIHSSPDWFDAFLEAERSGRSFVVVATERGLITSR
jgi:AbiV family abortive infection protein